MPERLLAAGVSWKVYNDPTGLIGLSPLPYFKAYNNPFSITGFELVSKALTPVYPSSFASDVKAGKLPSVSWIIPPLAECEHPAAPPEYGEYLVQQILTTLTSNPDVWAQTVFLVSYDENGGFFDHVPPPVAPAGHGGGIPDRHAAVRCVRHRRADRARLPHARPGHLAVQPGRLRGLAAPSTTPRRCASSRRCSAWKSPTCRRGGARVTGDMTSALALANPPNTSVPSAPGDLARRHDRGRGGRAERAGRHARRRHPVPAAHDELDALPGDHAEPAAGTQLTSARPRAIPAPD